MRKSELEALLEKKKKSELIEIILTLHTDIPRIRQNICNIVSPPTIDWDELYSTCMDQVTKASTSNKINRLNVPSVALMNFTEFNPDKDLAMMYMYESFEVLVIGLLSFKYRDSFKYSWVGGYGYECRKYMKKRHWLDSDVDAKMEEIVATYFKRKSEDYKGIMMFLK